MGKFQKYMIIVVGAAAAVWLVVAVINFRQEGHFDFGGIVLFGVVIVALALSGRQRPRKRP